jgi:hypothetical protein
MRWCGPTKHDARPYFKTREESMKIARMSLVGLVPMVAAGMLVYAGVAYPQTEKKIVNKPGEEPIALHRVGEKSAAVNLTAVGKEVSPGVFEVDPNSIYNKRLVIDGKPKRVCLGKWIATKQGALCEGSWVEGI